MSRDALLVVLAIAVVVNFAFIAQVAVLQRRRREAAQAAIAGARPSPVAPAGTGPPGGPGAPDPAGLVALEPTHAGASRTPALDPARAPVADPGPPVAPPPAHAGADVAAAAAPAASPTSAAPSGAADATRSASRKRAGAEGSGEPTTRPTSRTRRFAMPRVEEDRGRTEAAIGAFLGEPSHTPGTAQAHRPRRRSRRQRAPGEVPLPPTVVVAALAGWDELRHLTGREGAGRFSEALGNAIRSTIRSGDELMELGEGRLRIVVHADEEGARALIVRAATICDPWLRAAPVPLSLRARTVGARPETNGRSPTPPVPEPSSRQRAATGGRAVPPADPA